MNCPLGTHPNIAACKEHAKNFLSATIVFSEIGYAGVGLENYSVDRKCYAMYWTLGGCESLTLMPCNAAQPQSRGKVK